MDYAWDSDGNKVSIINAVRGLKYSCPSCSERVIVRKGDQKNAFAHMPKKNRTPLERACPLYHEPLGENNKKISDGYEKDSIQHELFTLYLRGQEECYELRAYFPLISERSTKYLKESNAHIFVSKGNIKYADYIAHELNYCPVDSIDGWFNVSCNVDVDPDVYKDIQVKWLHGFRGVDIKKDLFHSHTEGGYRVAGNSNIRTNRQYLLLSDYLPNCLGIHFTRKGEITLSSDLRSIPKKVYTVYEMTVCEISLETQQYVQSRGYHLTEQDSKLVPLWPPVRQVGRSIIYTRRDLFLYHNKVAHQQILLSSLDGSSLLEESENIVQVNACSDVLLQIYDREHTAKLAFDFHKVQTILQNSLFVPKIMIKCKDQYDLLSLENFRPEKGDEIEVESDIEVHILTKRGFLRSLLSCCRAKIGDDEIFAFVPIFYREVLVYQNPASNRRNICSALDNDMEYLRRCCGPYEAVYHELFEAFKLAEDCVECKQLLETWIKTNKVPIKARTRISTMLNYGGEKNDTR